MAARRAAGFRGGDWRAAEIRAVEIRGAETREAGCQAVETREAGWRAVETREAGWRGVETREAGCWAVETREAGCWAAETREAGCRAVDNRLSQVAGSLQPAATPQRKPVNFDMTRNDKLWLPGCTLHTALLAGLALCSGPRSCSQGAQPAQRNQPARPGGGRQNRPCRVPGGGEAASPGGGVAAWAGGGDWTRPGGGGLGWADCSGGEAAAPGGGDWTSSGGGELGWADGGGGDAAAGGGEAAARGGGEWTSASGDEDSWASGGGLGKTGIGGLLTCGSAMALPRYMGLLANAVNLILAGIHLGQAQAAWAPRWCRVRLDPCQPERLLGTPPHLQSTQSAVQVFLPMQQHTHTQAVVQRRAMLQRSELIKKIYPSTAEGQAPAQQQAAAAQQLFRCCWARSHCRAWARI